MRTKCRIPCGVINWALVTFSALAIGGARADTWTDPDTGSTWSYRIRGDVAEIYKSNSEAISPKPTGSMTIPSSLGGKPVTSLGASAFKGCDELVDVVIPNTLTNIGSSAFNDCSNLVSVVVPDGVTRIGGSAFSGCSALANVTIPTSVTTIGSSAFKDCDHVTSVTIPQYVCTRKIPTIFPSSYQLITSVTLLPDVTNIGSSAFKGCSALTNLEIPNGVTNIGSSAFSGCSGLTGIVIPDGVRRIGGSAFLGCSGLTNVTIPTSVTNVGSSAFKDCGRLTSVTVPQCVCARKFSSVFPSAYQAITDVVILSDVTKIGASAFKDCSRLAKVFFEGDAPTVGKNAFAGVGSGCTVYVGRNSIGWGGAVPGIWEGLRIEYSGGAEMVASDLWPRGSGGAVSSATASVYDGYMHDRGGAVVGTIQVKVGKPNARTKLSVVRVTVVGRDGRKSSLVAAGTGRALIAAEGPTTIMCGDNCVVTLSAQGMCGRYGNYTIDGALNVFMSRDDANKAVASSVLGTWQGAVNVAWPDAQGWNALTATIAARGKVTVTGTLANGAKVNAKSQLVVGEGWCCVPVVYAKRDDRMAFNMWLPKAVTSTALPGVVGIADAVVGRPGSLKGGAKFHLGAVMGDAKYASYLPDGVAVGGGARWSLPTAGKVQLTRDGQVDAAKLGENPSALRLIYRAKDGSFRGTFKAYADVNGRPKPTTVKVAGVLVNGIGYGTATTKGVRAPVMVE